MPDITLGNYEIDEDGNGNLVIKDKNDTVVFQYDDASSTFQPQVEFDFGSNDISNVGSINTDEASVTNETLVVARTDAAVTSIGADTFTSPSYGAVIKDERGEFSSDTFTPDKSAYYFISAYARAEGPNITDGDPLNTRIRNVTDEDDVFLAPARTASGGTPQEFPEIVTVAKLEQGKDYKVQVRDRSNSFDIAKFNGRVTFRSTFREF